MPSLPGFRGFRLSASPSIDELCRIVANGFLSVGESLAGLLSSPRANTARLTGVAVSVAGVVINHGLSLPAGVVPSGWTIIDINTLATVRRVAWTNTTITLAASAPVVVSLEVF